MTDHRSAILRALPYEARTILLDIVWLSAHTTVTLCGLGDPIAHIVADATTHEAAQLWDEMTTP